MPVKVNGQVYYRTADVCRTIGVSRATFFRWLRGGVLPEARYRDRRGWRLFTRDEVNSYKVEANRVTESSRLELSYCQAGRVNN